MEHKGRLEHAATIGIAALWLVLTCWFASIHLHALALSSALCLLCWAILTLNCRPTRDWLARQPLFRRSALREIRYSRLQATLVARLETSPIGMYRITYRITKADGTTEYHTRESGFTTKAGRISMDIIHSLIRSDGWVPTQETTIETPVKNISF
jgi:hypothetical protein